MKNQPQKRKILGNYSVPKFLIGADLSFRPIKNGCLIKYILAIRRGVPAGRPRLDRHVSGCILQESSMQQSSFKVMCMTTTVPFPGDQPVAPTRMVTCLNILYIKNNVLNSYNIGS